MFKFTKIYTRIVNTSGLLDLQVKETLFLKKGYGSCGETKGCFGFPTGCIETETCLLLATWQPDCSDDFSPIKAFYKAFNHKGGKLNPFLSKTSNDSDTDNEDDNDNQE